jgi:hypothetical protein
MPFLFVEVTAPVNRYDITHVGSLYVSSLIETALYAPALTITVPFLIESGFPVFSFISERNALEKDGIFILTSTDFP